MRDFLPEPMLREKKEDGSFDSAGKVIAKLSEATPQQCEDMLEVYYERRALVSGFGNPDLVHQMDYYIAQIEQRIDAFERGDLERPQEKVVKKPFSGLRIRDKD